MRAKSCIPPIPYFARMAGSYKGIFARVAGPHGKKTWGQSS